MKALLVLALMAIAGAARADDSVTIPSPEELSLQTFAEANPTCAEWGDGCSVCQRGHTDYGHCSTPGIACEPTEILCKRHSAAK